MSGEAGNAYVSVIPEVEGSPQSVGNELGTKLAGGMKAPFAAGAVALGNMLSDALTSVGSSIGEQVSKTFWNYADYEQLVGGVDTLFKNASQTVQANAQKAFSTAGMSANQYMENVTSFSASLIQSLGGDTEKAASIADKAIIDMSDNANKMGTDIGSITQAYQGFAKQNYTMLDNLKLGYGGTKSEMERLLQDASKIANTEFNIDSYADVIEAIHVMQESMGIAGTTMEEGSKTISGSLNQLNGAWENFLTAIGDGGQTMDLTGVTDALINSIGDVAYNVVPALVRIGETIALELPGILLNSVQTGLAGSGEFISTVFGEQAGNAVQAFTAELAPLGGEIENIFSNVSSILEQALAPVIQIVTPILANLSGAFTNAVSIILGALSGVTGFLDTSVMPTIQAVADLITPIIDMVSADVSNALQDIQNEVGISFNAVLDVVEDVWPGIESIIKDVVTTVANVVRTVWPVIKTIASTVFGAVKSVVQTVWPVVAGIIKTAVTMAKNVVSSATGAIKRAFDGLKSISGAVRNAFNAVKDAITKPIETAKKLIQDAINKISSIISGVNLKLPSIALPHFHVSGGSFPWGIGGKGSMPSFSVDWYKSGGIIGDMALIGAGEAGTEFIWPGYDPYMSKYARAIADYMPTNNGITVNFTYSGDADATEAVNLLTRNLRQLKATGAF